MDPPTKKLKTEPVAMEQDFPNVSLEPVPADYLSLPEQILQTKEPVFYHFKVYYDQSWNYAAISEKLFLKDLPYLCVIEHLGMPNTHVHFQGSSMVTENTFRDKLKILASKHHMRKIKPTARPTSMVHRPADAVGFQYMAKEVNISYVLAINKFTMEDLRELKEKSTLHCQMLKTSVRDFIANLSKDNFGRLILSQTGGTRDKDQIIVQAGKFLFEAQDKGKIELPEYNKHHTRNSIIRGIIANPACPRSLKAELYTI